MKGFDWIFFAVMVPWLVLAIVELVRNGLPGARHGPSSPAGRYTPRELSDAFPPEWGRER